MKENCFILSNSLLHERRANYRVDNITPSFHQRRKIDVALVQAREEDLRPQTDRSSCE